MGAGGEGRAAATLLYVRAVGGGCDGGRDQRRSKARWRPVAVRTQGLCIVEERRRKKEEEEEKGKKEEEK